MTLPDMKTIRMSVFWILLAVAAVLVLNSQLRLTFDLSAFFPKKTSVTQEILLEQLKNGPGSRLIVIGLKGGSEDQLREYSDRMKLALNSDVAFLNVLNGDFSLDGISIPEPLKSYHLLLDDIDYSQESLEQALIARQRDLAFGGGSLLLEVIARDPFLHTLEVLERLSPVNNDGNTWFAADGSAVLLAETRAAAIDIEAQAQAIMSIRQAFSELPGSESLQLELTGVGAFSVELQGTIRSEATKRTIIAIASLLVILLLVYRKVSMVLLSAVPIAMGFLVGLAALALIFTNVHGITLAFGFTLMGVAIDYPLHLFSHARNGTGVASIKLIWPTLRIGAASTVIAYIAIALSGSDGLAQLGVFTACGVTVAALVTRYWLPLLMPQKPLLPENSSDQVCQASLKFLPGVSVLVLTVIGAQFALNQGLWDDRLSSLSPVPEQRLLKDNLLRAAAGTPDMRYQLVLRSADLETLLRESESVDLLLQDAVEDGLLKSWQSISLILPSQSSQQRRQQSIPDEQTMHARLSKAAENTSFRADAFVAFEENAGWVKMTTSLLPDQFRTSLLSSWLDAHLIQVSDQWVSLITLSGINPGELAARIETWEPGVELVDLQQSSNGLMRDYRLSAMKTVFFASLLIIILLLFEQKAPARVAWVVLTVLASLTFTTMTAALLHSGLTIIHIVALLLVMGLGLDYALFLSRTEGRDEQLSSRHAVAACAITTTVTFGILAGSSIPVLKFIGLTVAIGSASSFVLALFGSRMSQKKT